MCKVKMLRDGTQKSAPFASLMTRVGLEQCKAALCPSALGSLVRAGSRRFPLQPRTV